MKNKIILFGAGFYGQKTFMNLKNQYEILCFADNNHLIAGSKVCGIPVVSGAELSNYDMNEADVIICVKSYKPITEQLIAMGITDYYVMVDGFLYHNDLHETMMPVELRQFPYFRKEKNEKNILFVQNAACIRTHKIAAVMKNKGYKVYLLYTLAPPEDVNGAFAANYENIWGFSTINGVRSFIENSDFDVIHCSNEPDVLVNIALMTSKPVVFDTHDMQSIRSKVSIEELALEYLANRYSEGNIYTSPGVVEIAKRKYGLQKHKLAALENMVLEQAEVTNPQKKLSASDHEIHCVYEGGVVGNSIAHHRYFERIWLSIASCGIHIHFYSLSDLNYCRQLEKQHPYIHFEGNMGSQELINEMTKYDCGLAVFNVTEENRIFLETGTANKIYEYLNSCLPIVVGNIQSHIDFVETYHVGIELDFSKDIKKQMEKAREIKIENDFLINHELTMQSRGDELADFYEGVMKGVRNYD